MILNRLWAGAALLAALGGVAALALADRSDPPIAARVPAERPVLALLTSLPLVFETSFGLDGGGSAALTRLELRYKVLPIGVANAASLSDQRLLLMAHPRAQPAEALVDLDRWVRGGGRLLLLADPKLDWESDRPLGDRLRPPPAFADTGLLAHWGLRLRGPEADDPSGKGKLEAHASSQGKPEGQRCEIWGKGFVARCRLGSGAATIIADADFLNGEPQDLDLLMDELARLESR
ncbi:MAG: hypothetical protein ACREBK_07910 [Sphingomicrobium sp.]